jgi:glucoamylase
VGWAFNPNVSVNSTQWRLIDFTQSLDEWLQKQSNLSAEKLFANVSPSGAAAGAIIASPSRTSPDYYFHWIRDAALVMDVVLRVYEREVDPQKKSNLEKIISDYVGFSRKLQLTSNRSGGLGEPKFNVDGSAFHEEWGRPQNDGPALQAIGLIQYAHILLDRNESSWVRKNLYDGKLPTDSIIKANLEYVSHHWKDSSFDLWEEVKGTHFYTRVVQRRALVDGARLAYRLGDAGAGSWYQQQADSIQFELERHWDPTRGIWLATLDWSGGNAQKFSNLDTAVVLAVLHGYVGDQYLSPSEDRVLLTSLRLKQAFQKIYEVNLLHPSFAPAIGRYPEDIYDGLSAENAMLKYRGNPWVLTTCALAELYLRAALEWKKAGFIQITQINLPFFQDLAAQSGESIRWHNGQVFQSDSSEFRQIIGWIKKSSDDFLTRIRFHTPVDGSFAEQINRDTGFMQGAHDLTWSYGSFLTAYWSRVSLAKTSSK